MRERYAVNTAAAKTPFFEARLLSHIFVQNSKMTEACEKMIVVRESKSRDVFSKQRQNMNISE